MFIQKDPATKPANSSRLNLLIGVFLLIAVLVVYWPVLNFGYINFDDDVYVLNNPIVEKSLSIDGVISAFKTPHATYWIPLTWLSFMLDIAVFGKDPGGLHATNLFIHILNTLLVFSVFRRMSGAPFKSAVAALLFGVHPIHVESVAWVTERKDVLSTFFLLMSLSAYIRYVASPSVKKYLPVFLFFLMGIMAKPMVVTFPFALLLLDYWPLNRWRADVSGNEKSLSVIISLIKEKIPLLVISLAAGGLTFWLKQSGHVLRPSALYPFGLRIENALVSYAVYLGKMVWPVRLAIPYPYPAQIASWKTGAAILLLSIPTVVSIRMLKKYPFIGVGWFWYLGTLVPVIGLIQAGDQAMADRFAYIPFIGLYMMLVWGGGRLTEGLRFRKNTLPVIVAIVFLPLMVQARFQLRYWKNSISLFTHSLQVTDNNYIAHHNLGIALAEQNRMEDAVYHYLEALRIRPTHEITRINLGAARMKQGRVMDAVTQYRAVLASMPQSVGANFNLGNALVALGRYDEAVAHYKAALRSDPADADVQTNLGNALMKQGRHGEAILHYREAARLDAYDPYRKNNLGAALMEVGKVKEAEHRFLEALKIKPDFADAQNNRGVALARQNRVAEARDCFNAALRIAPDHADANKNLKILIGYGKRVNTDAAGIGR